MKKTLPIAEALRAREESRSRLMEFGDLRPGSLVESFRRCGKPGCRCMKPGERGHGPQWLLTRQVNGKTITVSIPADEVERVRLQIEEYRRFRDASRQFVEASERVCAARLAEAVSEKDAAKKGASKLPSTRKSQPKSSG
jgi:hypothetical protein